MTMVTHLVISSADRTDYINQTPGNFRVDTQSGIDLGDCGQVELCSAIVPNTFYNIVPQNQLFSLNSVQYTIPQGSYNLINLLTEITSLVVGANPSFSASYNPTVSAITFSNSSVYTLDFTQGYLYKTLGFINEVYTGATSYTGIYAPSLDTNYFLIDFDFGSSVKGSLSHTGEQKTATFIIPNTANQSFYTFFNSSQNYVMQSKTTRRLITSFNVTLRNIHGEPLVGASDWGCVLKFTKQSGI